MSTVIDGVNGKALHIKAECGQWCNLELVSGELLATHVLAKEKDGRQSEYDIPKLDYKEPFVAWRYPVWARCLLMGIDRMTTNEFAIDVLWKNYARRHNIEDTDILIIVNQSK